MTGSSFVAPPLRKDDDQVGFYDVGDVHVYNPVHEIEANETDGENDARVLVDVRRRESVQFVQILSGRQENGAVFFVVSRTVDDIEIVAGTWLVHGYTSTVGLHHKTNLLAKTRTTLA